MYYLALMLGFVTLTSVLLMFLGRRGGSKIFLAKLDLVSYILTSASVLSLIIATHGQISQTFLEWTGEDKNLSTSREELFLFLKEGCGTEPECAAVKLAITTIAVPRGASKYGTRVSFDVSRIPKLADRVRVYNAAFDQASDRSRILFTSFGLWISIFALCGVAIGLLRRVLVLRDAIES